VKGQAAKELRRPLKIWSASVTILSNISAPAEYHGSGPRTSPAKTAATSKLPARFRRGIVRCDLVRALHQFDLATRPRPHMVVDQRARG
jgi:hypothetical protein